MQWNLQLVCSVAMALLACSCKAKAVSDVPDVADQATVSTRAAPSRALAQEKAPTTTSLCEAAAQGDLLAVKEFSKDPSQRQSLCPDGLGENAQLDALMAAAVFGELQVAQFLIGEGFDPLKADNTGRSAYVWAASGNHPEVVDYFWREGARPRKDDPFIGAVLYSAGLWNRQPILDYYLAASVDLNAEHYGYTALEGAAQSGHLEIVKWLVNHGASTEGALDKARTFGREEVVAYLQSAAAKQRRAPAPDANGPS